MSTKRKPKANPEAAPAPAPATDAGPVVSFKGFNNDWTCRGHQFEIGKTYTVSGPVEACSSGFHACENPFDVLNYYPMSTSVFAEVEQGGALSRHDEDSKIASVSITIKAELKAPDFIKRAVAWLVAAATTNLAQGDRGHAAAQGDSGHAAAQGDSGHAAAQGDSGHAETLGKHSIAVACGYAAKTRAPETGAIMLACISSDDYATILAVRASKVGENGVKPGVWYSLNASGEFVEETE